MEMALAARDLFSPAGTSVPLLLLVAGLTAALYAVAFHSSGHLHLLVHLPHQALHRLAERHGPLLYLRLGSVHCIAVSSPDAAREVLKTHEAAFLDRPRPSAVHRLTYGGLDFSYSPYGPFWRFMKKACVQELLAGRTLDRLSHVRREEVVRLVASLWQSAAEGKPVDVGAALMGLTGNIVSRMVMSRRWTGEDNDTEEMRTVVAETAEVTSTFYLQDCIGAFKNWDVQGLGKRIDTVHRKYDVLMERILTARDAKRRQQQRGAAKAEDDGEGKGKDILDILFDMHEDDNAEMTLTRDNIKAFMLEIFTAGTDTTRMTVEWALSELINNPDVLRKAQEEMDAVVGKEMLLLHPTGTLVVRQSLEQCKVSGYDVLDNYKIMNQNVL